MKEKQAELGPNNLFCFNFPLLVALGYKKLC